MLAQDVKEPKPSPSFIAFPFANQSENKILSDYQRIRGKKSN